MEMNRRRFTGTLTGSLVASAAGLAWPGLAVAQAPIPDTLKILVGFPPGGPTDAAARRIAEVLRGSHARTILVDNKPGAAGRIAFEELRRSPADGSVMLLQPASVIALQPNVDPKNANYKPDDCAPVSGCCVIHYGFAVGPMVPESVRSMRGFLDWAKANPSQANFGSPGPGSPMQFLVNLLSRDTGVSLNHVAYKGSAPAIQDLLGGQIAAVCSPVGDSFPHLKSGRLRLLATSSDKRSRFTPDVPTFGEQGFKGLEMQEWFGLFMPKGTPSPVLNRAAQAIRHAVTVPEVIESFTRFGFEPESNTPEEFLRLMQQDYNNWAARVKAIGFKLEG
jgi:tripartite-type tricarboxylate transporter receptor subunit TctC